MKKQIWQLRQLGNLDTLDIYVYGCIEGDGYDWWSGESIESNTSANHFKSELEKYPDVKFINLFVNSNGGDVMEAMAIRNQLKRHPAYVTGYVDGFACSAGSFILTGCDKVIMYSNTMQMLHNMWQYCAGNYKELRKYSDDLEQISIGNRQAYVEKSNGKMNVEDVTRILDNSSWLTAEQCLEYGLADEIVNETKDLVEAQKIAQQVNKNLQQQMNYNKALVALKQLMVDEPKQPIVPKEAVPAVEPPKENKLQQFMLGIQRKEGI